MGTERNRGGGEDVLLVRLHGLLGDVVNVNKPVSPRVRKLVLLAGVLGVGDVGCAYERKSACLLREWGSSPGSEEAEVRMEIFAKLRRGGERVEKQLLLIGSCMVAERKNEIMEAMGGKIENNF